MPYQSQTNTAAQQDARSQWLRYRTEAIAEAKKEAEKGFKTTGKPVASSMEEVTVTAPAVTYEEARATGAAEELGFAKQVVKDIPRSMAANLAGLPVDLINIPRMLSGREPIETASSEYFKGLFGVEPDSVGSVAGDFIDMPVGALKAGLFVPIALWKNTREADEAERIINELSRQYRGQSLVRGSPEWLNMNREIFKRTGGWFLDLSHRIRRYVPTAEGVLSPAVKYENKMAKITEDSVLGDFLDPKVWDNFDKDTAEFLQRIPINSIKGSATLGGTWSEEAGIGLNVKRIGENPQMLLDILEHEVEHAFQFLAGSGKGGYVNVNDPVYKAAIDNAENTESAAYNFLVNDHYTPQAITSIKFKIGYMAKMAAREGGLKQLENVDTNDWQAYKQKWEKIPALKAMFTAAVTKEREYQRLLKDYMNLSGEIMARMASISREEGLPMDLMAQSHEATNLAAAVRKGEGLERGIGELPQRNLGQALVSASEVLPPNVNASDIAAGKYDDELRRLISEQLGEAKKEGTKFENPELNRQVQEAATKAGATPTDVPVDRLNKQFPPKTGDYITGAQGEERTVQTMRTPDTQGAKVSDVRGGPPTEIRGYGELLENAQTLAVGREEVWKKGKFDVEAFKNKVASVERERMLGASKGAKGESAAKQTENPKFWAFDPQTKKVMVVTADGKGGYTIKGKTGKFDPTEENMKKVDLVANRAGLEEFINIVLSKERPRPRGVGPVTPETTFEQMSTEQIINYLGKETQVSRDTLLENLTPEERLNYLLK